VRRAPRKTAPQLLAARAMIRLLLVGVTLLACNRDRPLANSHCQTSIAEYCATAECPSISNWCAGAMTYPYYGWNGIGTCNGWSWIHQPLFDQGRDYYYDSTGNLVAVMATVSNPPCEGSCVYVCVAGPSDVGTADVESCNVKVDGTHCGAYTIAYSDDGGYSLSRSDGGTL
jgi:hypothetical protein